MAKDVTNYDDVELLGLSEDVDPSAEISQEQTVAEIERLQAKLQEAIAAKEASLPRCGHVNSHSFDLNNQKDNLACTRAVGHAGNHSAMHLEVDPLGEGSKERLVEWTDAAGADWPKYEPPPPDWQDGETGEMKWGVGTPK